MATVKRANKKTISRQEKMKEEIYSILQKEAHNWFSIIERRENSVSKRLSAMEKNGIPDGILEELKKDMSSIKYMVRKQTTAIVELLSFLRATKELLSINEEEKAE